MERKSSHASISYQNKDYYDERIGSRAVASKIKAVAHEVEITAKDYLDNIGRVIYHLDEPTLGTGALPQYMVAKLVSLLALSLFCSRKMREFCFVTFVGV